ncbi:MAG: antitoxin [Ornithinibacter sp.]
MPWVDHGDAQEDQMKIIRTAALVAAATAALSKAKEYARDNPAQASETIDKVEGFVRGKAGPKYAGKIGQGSDALRKGLGLKGRAPAAAFDEGSRPVNAPSSGAASTARFDPSI